MNYRHAFHAGNFADVVVFDPTTVACPTLAADRRVGGAGLLFVRALMDEARAAVRAA